MKKRTVGFILALIAMFSFVGCSWVDVMTFPFNLGNGCSRQDPYQALQNYLLENGNDGADLWDLGDGYDCMLSYDEEEGLSFGLFYQINGYDNAILLNDLNRENACPTVLGRYNSTGTEFDYSGYIRRADFSSANRVIYSFASTAYLESLHQSLKNLAGCGVDLLLLSVSEIITDYDIGITLADLGFSQYA